jgi:hypothetical protein
VRTWRPIRARCLVATAALAIAGCTAQVYEGEHRATGDLAVINVGSTVVRQIDGQHRRGGAFDVEAFEVEPGPHQVVLVFELPARALGLKSLPAQPGVGVCELKFEARPGRQYYLVARPLGDFNSPRWRGNWEAWVRDPAIASDDDVIARCEGTEPTETPTPLIAGATPPAGGAAVPAVAVAVPAPTPLPLPVARALRVGAWHLAGLASASSTDLSAAAATIRDGFDVLTIAPPLAPAPLLGALGSAWASMATETDTVFYRRDVVRPCSRPSPVALCLESIDSPADAAHPLLLQIPPAGAPR